MDQDQLENKVKELLTNQGFNIGENKNNYSVREDGEEVFKAVVFSSSKYTEKDVRDQDFSDGTKLFVDEGLSGIKDDFAKTDVSIVKEYSSRDYNLPSFELIGDIAIINELAQHDKEEAVEAILEHHDVKTILLKTSQLSGEFRVGDYQKLHGEDTETIHKEHGYRFKVDPTQAYYSERFSTERKRVADQVEEGEKVLVMFAGVGPFAIMAADKAQKVTAIEKNPQACEYLKQNIKLNKKQNKIEAKCGDVREILPKINQKFDRIIMPLPKTAIEYLDIAIDSSSRNSTIHLYTFIQEKNFEPTISRIREITDQKDVEFEVLDKIQCGYKSPSEDRYCIDVRLAEN